MKQLRFGLIAAAGIALLATLLSGCSTGGTSDAPPAAPQTGDTSLFANPKLLAAPDTFIAKDAIVLDTRHSLEEYDAGHIPGAIFAPATKFTNDTNELLPVDELEDILGTMGISQASKIVIYDNTSASLGAAGFIFWMLEYLGCTDVALLNGGWDQWVYQERPIEKNTPLPLATTLFTATINQGTYGITKEELLSRLEDPSLIILDVRSSQEYYGTKPDDEAPRPGHIPGADNIPYTAFYNADKTVLNFSDLKALLAAHDITAYSEVAVYSTVGKRSGFFYFLARLMGYTKVVNYSGSIVDWGNADPTLYPVEQY